MSNKASVPHDFLLAFKPILAKFKDRDISPSLFHVPDLSADSLYSIALTYYKEFSHSDLKNEDIERYGLKVLDYDKFAKFPPRPREFILELKKLRDSERFYSEDNKLLIYLYDWLDRRYPGLWSNSREKENVVSDWKGFLDDCQCSDFDVDYVISKIRKSSEHSKFPPTNAEIERYLRISSFKEDIPSGLEAYLQASRHQLKSSEMPLIVRHAKRTFGSYSLRTRADQSVQRDFIAMYNTIVDEYLSGNLNLKKEFENSFSQDQKRDRLKSEDPRMGKADLSELISRM